MGQLVEVALEIDVALKEQYEAGAQAAGLYRRWPETD